VRVAPPPRGGEAEGEFEGVAEGAPLTEGVPLALRAAGALPDGEAPLLREAVGVPLRVPVRVPVGEPVPVGEALSLPEAAAVALGDAPGERGGEADAVGVALALPVGVSVGVSLELAPLLPLAEAARDALAAPALLAAPGREGLAPRVRAAVGDAVPV